MCPFCFCRERQCPVCSFRTADIQKYKLHLAVQHGEREWCGFGCHFEFASSAAYLYRRHIEKEHHGVYIPSVSQPPTETARSSRDDEPPSLEVDQLVDQVQPAVDQGDTQPMNESVEDILRELLPPGCLSPLPITPPRPPPLKKSKIEKPKSPAKFTAPRIDIPTIPLNPSFPTPASEDTEVIDARFTGDVHYQLIPIDIPQNIRPAGRDPRVEGILMRRSYRL